LKKGDLKVGLREKLDAILGVPKQEDAQATEEKVETTDFTEHVAGLKARITELEQYNIIYKRDVERNEKEVTRLKAIISKLEEKKQ
jgi:polyhydroxyalkanoate synthesis regulator phasin